MKGGGAIEAGERLAASYGLDRIVLRALGNRASGLADTDPRTGLEVARAELTLERRVGRRSAQCFAMITFNATRVGEWEWALEVLGETLADTTEPSLRAELLSDIASLRAAQGEPVDDIAPRARGAGRGRDGTVHSQQSELGAILGQLRDGQARQPLVPRCFGWPS